MQCSNLHTSNGRPLSCLVSSVRLEGIKKAFMFTGKTLTKMNLLYFTNHLDKSFRPGLDIKKHLRTFLKNTEDWALVQRLRFKPRDHNLSGVR